MARFGTGLRPIWAAALDGLDLGDGWFRALAAFVVAGETFIGLGLWPRRTRPAALIAGILLHASILILIDGVDLFTPVMLVGYLGFPLGSDARQIEPMAARPPRAETALAGLVAIAMILMPLRIYSGPIAEARTLSFFDRSPWSFSMFLFLQTIDQAEAATLGTDGIWRPVEIPGRGVRGGSDLELEALARYLLATRPDVNAVRVRCRLTINHRRCLTKELAITRASSPRTKGNKVASP